MEIDIKRLFEDFLNLKDIRNGKTAKEIVEERYEAYDSLRDMFVNIDSLTKEDFKSFAKNNKSWDKLERQKKWYLADMEKLKESLKYLLDESINIQDRFDNMVYLHGKYHVRGISNGLATAILHLYNPKEYGVWNKRSKKALYLLGKTPEVTGSWGSDYIAINKKLYELRDFLGTDLTTLDCFLGKIAVKSKEYFEDFIIYETLEESEKYFEKKVKDQPLEKDKLLQSIKEKKYSKKKNYQLVKQYFRDPRIAALALIRAKGNCECCNKLAPFQRADKTPYLETHHLIPLAKDGVDEINNVCAICPNCHRELHSGEKKKAITQRLIKKILKKNIDQGFL